MSMPLQGIRVLDMTTGQQGPVASQYLGDMGADVIKIEDPVRGDMNRGLERSRGVSLVLSGGRNALMEAFNRNKRGLAIDLKRDEGKEVIYRLVEKSDVFVQNFRPGVATRLGVDYQTLSKYNPRLIYGSANCYGQKGPDAHKAGNDLAAVARSGLLLQTGDRSSPTVIADTLGDRVGAILLAYGLVLALLARERLGVGQEVQASLLGSLIHLQGFNLGITLLTRKSLPNPGKARVGRPFWNVYKCKDGHFIALSHTLEPDRYWPLFCKALGISELATDPRFDSGKKREDNSAVLIPILDRVFATKTYEEWAQLLNQEMGDFIFDRVQQVSELTSDPQVTENEYIVDFEHAALGLVKMEGIAVHLSETPGSIRLPAPELGEHTEEILLGFGYTWDDIGKLKEEGIIR